MARSLRALGPPDRRAERPGIARTLRHASRPPRFDLAAAIAAPDLDAGGDALAAALGDAADGPLLVLLDDLHWADAASLALLRALARHLPQRQLLIAATHRDRATAPTQPLHALLPSLVREGEPQRLRLAPLDDDAVRTLLWARYGLGPADAERLRAYLGERAEGNPLFIDELLRACEGRGELRRAAPHDTEWHLGELTYAGVPPLVAQLVDGQGAALGAETEELLTIAAILGREVTLALWAEVAGVPEERLLGVVDRAIAADLIDESAHGEGIRFRYALVREALCGRQSASRRRAWHRRAGEALTAGARELPAAILDAACWHFTQAGDPRAVAWLIRAGEWAGRGGRWATTIAYLTRASALLRQSGADEATLGWLCYRLGRLQRYGDAAAGLEALARAEESAIARGDRALLVMATFGRAVLRTLRGQLHWGLAEMARALDDWATLTPAELDAPRAAGFAPLPEPPRGTHALLLATAGRLAEARALATQVAASASPEPPENRLESFSWCDATLTLAFCAVLQGDFPAAQAAFGAARAGYRRAAQHHLAGLSALVELETTLIFAADDLALRAQLAAEAEEAYGRADDTLGAQMARIARLRLLLLEGRWAEAREIAAHEATHGDIRRLGTATVLGRLAREQGDTAAAWQLVAQQLPSGVATPPGDAPFNETIALIELASALALDANDLPTMRSWLEVHDRWLAWAGTQYGRAASQLAWARYDRASGDLDGARRHAEQAIEEARRPRQPLALLAAERLLGELDLATGRLPEAGAHLGAARALADACAAPYERALTLVPLAELALARAAADVDGADAVPAEAAREAWLALDEVQTICTSLGALPLLARRDLLAARLNAVGPAVETPLLVVPAATIPPGQEVPGAPAENVAAPMPGLTLTAGPPRDLVPPSGLTQREVEVLRLIAAGLSNRDIAARLFLSVRTAERHIANIYKKIDAHSKADATAFAFNCGLL